MDIDFIQNEKKYRGKYRISSSRLLGYDYSQMGFYFVTICVSKRECLFGKVVQDIVELSKVGKIAERCMLEMPKHFKNIFLDEFIIMPNHVHFIVMIVYKDVINRVFINNKGGITGKNNPMGKKTLGEMVRWYKGLCTYKINLVQDSFKFKWQPRFYDKIIRHEKYLDNYRQYLLNNPKNWIYDNDIR